jgi:hypothetical protein
VLADQGVLDNGTPDITTADMVTLFHGGGERPFLLAVQRRY